VPDFYFLGEEELLTAFRLVGVDGRAVVGRDEALEAFRLATGQSPREKAVREEPVAKVLILSSSVASLLEEETRDWQYGGEYPLVVEIPSPGSGPEEGRSLVAAIREAVGISI
jgi:V/A-type H+-transporting ATPase subunit F